MENFQVEIAKLIGSPIDPNLKCPVELQEMCDIETAEPGEPVYLFTDDDGNGVDKIYAVDTTNGYIMNVKISLTEPTALTFTFLQSKREYVLLSDILGTNAYGVSGGKTGADQLAFARRKNAIARSMDKKEVKSCFDAILAVSGQEVAQATGEDIYDVISNMIEKIEDYSTDYILFMGATAWKTMNDYEKDKAATHNYDVSIEKMLAKHQVKAMKVIGNIQYRDSSDASGSNLAVLNTNTMVMVGRNSSLTAGKPLVFVRRKIANAVSELNNVTVDAKERGLFISNAPMSLGSNDIEGYGVYGFESVVIALKNYRATCWAVLS